MYKFQPYSQFEIFAIESWLNETAARGYKLISFGAFICKFERNHGRRIYYRVRYIPANKDIKGTLFWGDLYVYQSENPHELPSANYDEDAQKCATVHGKPHVMMLDLVVISTTIKSFFPLPAGDPLLLFATIGAILLWALHLVSNGLVWFRAMQISSSSKTSNLPPPNKHLRIITLLEYIPAVAIILLAIVAQLS